MYQTSATEFIIHHNIFVFVSYGTENQRRNYVANTP